ncbi:hypothetical protein ALI144C_13710 [Actinosynnema sp. ALI-1.44]|nr:hypothetical protein ALI144C_13710 [Actinosynnema sp. ALI-1.44]
MDLGLRDKVVLVTAGSGAGVGSATARAYGAEGAKVAITYRSHPEAAEKIAEEVERLGGTAITVHYDLADPSTIDGAVRTVADRWGGIDVLVANASSGPASMPGTAFADIPVRSWRAKLRTDIEGTFYTAQMVIPWMNRREWGRIVFVSSTGWTHGRAGQFPYEAATGTAKAALHGLAHSLAVTLGSDAILVNLVSPGAIASVALEQFLGPDGVIALRKTTATGRISTAEDIANAILFLGSAANRNITAATLPVDGGI